MRWPQDSSPYFFSRKLGCGKCGSMMTGGFPSGKPHLAAYVTLFPVFHSGSAVPWCNEVVDGCRQGTVLARRGSTLAA
jgi:hypothetical protein